MRPKKLVLVLDPNAERLPITMFALLVNGYRAVGANTVEQAAATIKQHQVDAILFQPDDKNADLFTHSVRMGTTMEMTLGYLRTAVQKKRGPSHGNYVEMKKGVDISANLQNT